MATRGGVGLGGFCLGLVLVVLGLSYVLGQSQEVLDIHIIAHTHDDVGWLKTVDEYYYGANSSIQDAGVQYILDTVISALNENPQRKFIYVEIAFFTRWWNEQTDEVKENVRELVANGQLEFINGGWCMNDEAGASYEDTVTQMTAGHQFLLQEFGVTPTIGWQIDPFGHANAQATLFGQMGFNAVFFARIDYQDYAIRSANKALEFVWRPSHTFGPQSDILGHSLYELTYCYPNDFAFEWGDDPIQTDPRLFNLNVIAKGEEFAQQMRQRAESYSTNQILVTFGCDFQFQNAFINFKNMDKLIAYINSNSSLGLNIFYSTPSQYIQALANTGQAFPLKTDDIFPYASSPEALWTGYFTSRPALKAYIRARSNLEAGINKIYTFTAFGDNYNETTEIEEIETLTDALSVAQHHDAVAGTEQQHVAYDYAERLSIGTASAEEALSKSLSQLVSNYSTSDITFSYCEYLNISICPPLNDIHSAVPIVVYNPVSWARTEYIRLPTNTSAVEVLDNSNEPVEIQILPCEDPSAKYTVVFPAKIPALGFTVFYIKETNTSGEVDRPTGATSISNDVFEIFFTKNSVSSVTIAGSNTPFPLTQQWLWYNASDNQYGQASGAYVFRPNSSTPFLVGEPTLEIYSGQYVQEARQVWADWVTQTIRLYQGQNWIEFEGTVGPIPIGDGLGKEVISRYQTALNTNKTFYTDSQGLEFQERILNYRFSWNYTVVENVSSNYYPIDHAIHIIDVNTTEQFGVVVDHSRGGSSLADGQVETMCHRRLLYDDGFGVGEPLNESTIVRSTQNVVIGPSFNGTLALERQRMVLLNHPVILAFGAPKGTSGIVTTSFSPLINSLPLNVYLETFNLQTDGSVLLRLHHLFAPGEDETLSAPVTVDLTQVFTNLIPTDLIEMSLTANQPISSINRIQWNVQGEPAKKKAPVKAQISDNFQVTLNPQEIRTFFARFITTN